MNNIIAAGFLIGILAMMFYTPAKYMQGIIKLSYGDITTGEKIRSFIPIYNLCKAERLYTGRVSIAGISAITLILTLGLRIVTVFLLPSIRGVQIVTVILFLLSILFVYCANVYIVFIVFKDAGVKGGWWRAILFPIGQYYIGTYLNNVIKHEVEKEETF